MIGYSAARRRDLASTWWSCGASRSSLFIDYLERTFMARLLTSGPMIVFRSTWHAWLSRHHRSRRRSPDSFIQITVDQFRGDLPTRYFERLGKGGLRYLLKKGIHYNNAHHAHANTETIVGHATLATGATPRSPRHDRQYLVRSYDRRHDLQHRGPRLQAFSLRGPTLMPRRRSTPLRKPPPAMAALRGRS